MHDAYTSSARTFVLHNFLAGHANRRATHLSHQSTLKYRGALQYRAELHGRFYGKARPVIDWLFSLLGQKDHCKTAYECAKLNLPEDMRG